MLLSCIEPLEMGRFILFLFLLSSFTLCSNAGVLPSEAVINQGKLDF